MKNLIFLALVFLINSCGTPGVPPNRIYLKKDPTGAKSKVSIQQFGSYRRPYTKLCDLNIPAKKNDHGEVNVKAYYKDLAREARLCGANTVLLISVVYRPHATYISALAVIPSKSR